MNDEEIQNQIFGFLRIKYKPNEPWGISSQEISEVLGVDQDDIDTNLHHMDRKDWITLDDSSYEYEVYLEPKGFDEFVKRNKKLSTKEHKPTAHVSPDVVRGFEQTDVSYSRNKTEDPKKMLKSFQEDIATSVKNRDYNAIIVDVDRLYIFMKKIGLSIADRTHLEREMELLSNLSRNMSISKLSIKDEKYLESEHEKSIVPEFNTVNRHLDVIIRNPQEIKYLIKQIKKKENFISNLKNKLNFKKYLDVKNTPDVFYDNLLVEINKAYNNDMALTLLILLRKLFETGIIDIIWKKYKSDEMYMTKKGGFIQFSVILEELKKQTKSGGFGHFKEDMLELIDFVDQIRKKGNQSAHRLTFKISISEMEKIKTETRRMSDILFRIHSNV